MSKRSDIIRQVADDYDQRIVDAAAAVDLSPDELIDLCHEHSRKVRDAVRSTAEPTGFQRKKRYVGPSSVHLGLTTGRVACSERLIARYPVGQVTENWRKVKCEACKQTDHYKARVERGHYRKRIKAKK